MNNKDKRFLKEFAVAMIVAVVLMLLFISAIY